MSTATSHRLMQHDTDPKSALIAAVGDLSGLRVHHNIVLCAIYMRPERTHGGIIIPEKNRDEDQYQGKVCLILKTGPQAFKDADGKWFEGQDIGVGDWVVCRPSDGWNVTINGQPCRYIQDVKTWSDVQHPDAVW